MCTTRVPVVIADLSGCLPNQESAPLPARFAFSTTPVLARFDVNFPNSSMLRRRVTLASRLQETGVE
jgi:hypothetical protein